MSDPLRVLVIEDSEDDALLEIETLKPIGRDTSWTRVESPDDLAAALDHGSWDLVLSDFTLPSFNGFDALEIVRQHDQDIPFILISGTVGEEVAAEAMRRGANDFILKGRLQRLPPVVEREFRDCQARRESRRAETALRDSEERYRSLVEQAFDGIIIANGGGRFIDANSSALKMTGYDREELLTKCLDDLRARQQDTILPAESHECIARQRVIRKDGSTFDADISTTTLDAGRTLLVVRDVTEQVEAEELLRYREQLNRGLAELGHEVAAGTEKDPLLQFAAALAADKIRMDFCRITEPSDNGPLTRGEAGRLRLEKDPSCRLTSASLGRIAAASGPVKFEPEEGSDMERCLREMKISSSYGIPIGTSTRLLAVMDLHFCAARDLTADEASFLQSLSTLLSSALEQKQAQEALRRSETRFRRYFDLGLVGMMTAAADGRPLDVNARLCEMLGLTRDELLGRRSADVTAPEDIEKSATRLRELQKGETDRVFFDKCFTRKDGTILHANVSAGAVRTPDGNVDHLISIVQDVTEQKAAEQELFRREQEFKALVENSPDVITRFDRDLRRRYVNPAVEALTGIPASDFIGRSYEELNVSGGAVAETLRGVLASGKGTTIELTSAVAAGNRILQSRVVPEFDRNGMVESVLSITRDITEIRLSEERARASEAKLANAQRIAHVGSFELTVETREMVWSDELFRLVGLPIGEVPTLGYLLSLADPEDRDAITRAYRAATIDGQAQHLEHRVTRADGRRAIFAISMEPMTHDGRIVQVAGTVQDVTDLREAEQSVRNSEARLRSLIDSASDAILTLDTNGFATEVNPAVARMIGRPVESFVGRHITASVRPDRIAEVIQALNVVAKTGRAIHVEIPVRTESGEYIEVEASASLLERGGENAIFVIARDVTVQRRAEAERETLMREIETLLASTYEGICVTDLSGACTLVNASAGRMLGYEPAEMIGKDLHHLIHYKHPDGSPYAAEDCPISTAARENRQIHVVKEVLWRRDGTSFPVEIFVSPILSTGNARGIVTSFIDVTEQQSLRSELERANRLAALGRVAATMSHEFNNVLMGIQPFAEVLLHTSSDQRVMDAATRITQAVRRGRRVTEELRRFTRPASPTRSAIDVHSWLRECASEIGRMLPANVRFSLDLADEPMAIDADRDQMTQVVSNVVLNARDAIAPAAGMIAIRAGLANRHFEPLSGSDLDKAFVHLSVVDSGPGMTAETMAKIFEPFFTTKRNGTGLGLAISHQIITLHGGHIFVESEPDHGTSVHFFLPASSAPAAAPSAPLRDTTRAMLPAEVLLVEDDETVACGLQALLEEANIHVLLAHSAAEALDILDRARPEALIVDIGLPDSNGFDLYKRISSRMGALPVVFSSGHADAARVHELGPDSHAILLTKPYTFDDLLKTLQQLFEVTA